MTAAERRYVRKLELKIEEYEERRKHDMDIYREQSLEIIELRARLAYMEEIAREMVGVIEGPCTSGPKMK